MLLPDPDELGTYLAIRAAGRQWELPSWVEHYRLRPEDWPDFRSAVREALRHGPLSVPELGEALAAHRAYRHLLPEFHDGAGTLIKPLTWQGDMSLGPRRNGQRTVQGLAGNPRWAGIPDLEEAGPRAITAYLRSYGPATPEHVHHWLGANLSAGRKRLDRWLAGLADDLVTPPARREAMTRKANPVVAGGVVRGTWSLRKTDLTVTWLDDARVPRKAMALEANRLAGVLDEELTLRIET